MTTAEGQALLDLLRAIDEVSTGIGEAGEVLVRTPDSTDDMARWTTPQRIASRAFLKGVEQLQDLTARLIRLVLVLEGEEIAGLSARAIADRAETIGLIARSDLWSAIVKLRNQLVHEYPLSKAMQLVRFQSAWDANTGLMQTQAVIFEFLRNNGYPDEAS